MAPIFAHLRKTRGMGAICRWARIWMAAAKTAFVTHVLAVMVLAVFIGSELSGTQARVTEILGAQPGKLYTLLTHALMHSSWGHLLGNLVALEWAGPFVERWPAARVGKWMGKLFYVFAILCITMTGAHLAVTFAPDHWPDRSYSVGMSISTNAIMAVGLYIWLQNRMSGNTHRIVQLAQNARREIASWAAVAIVAALASAYLWLESGEAATTRIGHATGAVMGVGICLINAIVRTLRDEKQEGTAGNDQEAEEQTEDENSESTTPKTIAEDRRS